MCGYELVITDPWERYEIVRGCSLRSLTGRYFVLVSEDGREFLLSNRHSGVTIGQVHEGERVSVAVYQVREFSDEVLSYLKAGKEKRLVSQDLIQPYGIGDLRYTE